MFIVEKTINNSFDSEKTLYAFTLKSIILLMLAILLALVTDNVTSQLQKYVGAPAVICFVIQTAVILSTIYSLKLYNTHITNEFQSTLAGLIFVSIYFGLQTTYYANIHTTFEDMFKKKSSVVGLTS